MVSVIVPTYKRSERLPIALDSILNQTYKDIEIIVVDDNGDTPYRTETKTILKPYIEKNQITYIQHESNQGGCHARNTGAFGANGSYIAFLDDDDFYEPRKIEKQLEFIEKNKHLDACICDMFRVDAQKKQIVSRENEARGTQLKDTILDGNMFTSMLLIKKDVFITLKGFSDIPRYQDKYFQYKFLENNYNMGVLSTPLLTLVEHNDFRISLSASKKVIDSLETLHDFEIKHKKKFSQKEWKYIMHRYYYTKAYNVSQGRFGQRMVGIFNILKSLKYHTGHFNIIKLTAKTLTPNFILNYKNSKS